MFLKVFFKSFSFENLFVYRGSNDNSSTKSQPPNFATIKSNNFLDWACKDKSN